MNDRRTALDPSLPLGVPGFAYADLYRPERLAALLTVFDTEVKNGDAALAADFAAYRACQGEGMTPEAISDLLVRMAPQVGCFVAKLFNVSGERDQQIHAITDEMDTIFVFRSEVVMKCESRLKGADAASFNLAQIDQQIAVLKRAAFPAAVTDTDTERSLARVGAVLGRLVTHFELLTKNKPSDYVQAETEVARMRSALSADKEAANLFASALSQSDAGMFVSALIDPLNRWCFAALHLPERKEVVRHWMSFKSPAKTDFDHLVPVENEDRNTYSVLKGPHHHRRRRDGFHLTDTRATRRESLYEVDHCIYCHDRDTDSCSKGMRQKKDNSYKVNALGVTVTGCPLEEKISEMHLVKRRGDNIGALALIVIDNPMCAGTGHRICNDCMKGCIYQKTEPVNIPQIETNTLTDVLFMPWGFEIYSFLTRWNPLNIKRPHALPYNGKNVLVAGMGPAGYTLAHYLINEGFGVVGIDGLKIEPLPKELTGDTETPPRPIRDFNELYEDLDKRILMGFGGVAEYGITVRWDKNFLKVIYLTLARRSSFRVYGGVRFGGTLNIDDAWELGFDHIAIASGAGKPTVIGLKNNLIRGIRKASDFLMALQLTGAAKMSSMANLQVRLPAGVIGGGLTAIDTATELMAYYPVQVEKTLERHETLCAELGEAKVMSRFDTEEKAILEEFLTHGRAIRAERVRASAAGELPNFQPLLDSWGGVTQFYRKGLHDSPAYRQNHEEVHKGLEEGIAFAEGMDPREALEDENGHLRAVRFKKYKLDGGKWVDSGEQPEVPLRNLYIAAGTTPNTIYQTEYPNTFEMDGKFYQRCEPHWENGKLSLVPMHDTAQPKLGKPSPLTTYLKDGKTISFYGDNHPVYAGNVVKAMASAKDGYPYVIKLFEDNLRNLNPAQQRDRDSKLQSLFARLDDELIATVVEVKRLTPTIIDVIVRAKRAAQTFSPGQFYRVQNFEATARKIKDSTLAAEGLALTGAWVDKDKGLVSLIALEMGASSRMCAQWKPGERLIVMGATGTPTDIPAKQDVLLIGGGLGNAVLFSIGRAMRAVGSRVIYFAGYRNRADVFKEEDLEAAADVIVWAVDKRDGVEAIRARRPQDKSFVGNIVEAIQAYAKGDLGEQPIPLSGCAHMIVIGSDKMMAAVKAARFGVLKPYLKPGHHAIGSINSPMQCMMKGVCAQCLCKHVDPKTGEEFFVYSCNNQDQDLDAVDFQNLNARLRQNTVQEKVTDMWLDHLITHANQSS